MIILRRKNFGMILNTNSTPGFIRGRKYDQDMGRLGQMGTSQRELHRTGQLSQEMRKLGKELNNGRLGKWQHTD